MKEGLEGHLLFTKHKMLTKSEQCTDSPFDTDRF